MSVRGKQAAEPSKAKVRKRPKPQLEGVEPAAQIESFDSAALQRAAFDPATASPSDILALQRMAGNQAISGLIQTKVTVGPVGDKYEREADRVADQVLNQQPAASNQQQDLQPESHPCRKIVEACKVIDGKQRRRPDHADRRPEVLADHRKQQNCKKWVV